MVEMEPLDPFTNQPPEILLQTILQTDPRALPALCSSSKRLLQICTSFPEVRPLLLQGMYLNMPVDKVEEAFMSYVSDKARHRKEGGKDMKAINPTDLERLTAIVAAYPSFVNEIRKWKGVQGKQSPLEVTRDPTIVDLLLRYGAQTKYGGYPGRNVIKFRLFQDMRNGLIVRQMIAYGADVFGARARANVIKMLADNYFEIFYEFVHQRVLRGKDLELQPSLTKYYPNYYFLLLSLLQAGAPYSIIYNIASMDPFAFRLAASYQASGTAEGYEFHFRDEDEGSLNDLKAVLASPPINRVDFLALEYYQLRQLQNIGSNPYWNDEPFWAEKLERDFPGHIHPPGPAREGYLKLYELPEVNIQGPTGVYRLSLNYQTGLGFFTCLHLLGREVKINGVRLLGLSGLGRRYDISEIEDMESLYHVDIPPMDYTAPYGLHGLEAENSNYNLVFVEDLNDPKHNRMFIPNLFYPFVMKLLVDNKAYYLQFLEPDFLKGYLLLCKVLGLNPREHLQAVYKVKAQ